MASTERSPPSSNEIPQDTASSTEPTRAAASPDSNPHLGELTVVKVDPQRHPKNKRKRTQAGDKAVLEAAYQENPKPDKIARLEIVKRVSLNEKEVQIWFQNRRQNDRRKSRPLTPQEIAALRTGGMQIISDPSSANSSANSSILSDAPYCPTTRPIVDAHGNTPPLPSRGSGSPQLPEQHPGRETNESPANVDVYENGQAIPKTAEPTPSPESGLSPSFSQSFPGAAGYLANRWHSTGPFSTLPSLEGVADDSARNDPFASSCSSAQSEVNVLPRPSRVRLSFSFDGKAEIVSNEASPPKMRPERPMSAAPTLPQVAPRSLQRSHSALPSVTLPPISTLTGSLPPPRLSRGRSRDVNAWELCCDDDAPDDLTKMAENEANGSALAAISLLRSSGSVLQPSGSKRNAPLSRRSQQQAAKKPKLGRSHPSVSRLQGCGEDGPLAEKHGVPSKKLRVSMLVSPSGDSDKENWSPDDEGNPQLSPYPRGHRRPVGGSSASQAQRSDRILQDNGARAPAFLSAGSRANTAPTSRRGLKRGEAGEELAIFEDSTGRKRSRFSDDEVEKFMRGEVSPSKKGDVDCVAGLLALSQGNWR